MAEWHQEDRRIGVGTEMRRYIDSQEAGKSGLAGCNTPMILDEGPVAKSAGWAESGAGNA
jgi:hypothetical protein